jgi:NodT family efflux transporter outer membrane factor (OMF) lipoprotein
VGLFEASTGKRLNNWINILFVAIFKNILNDNFGGRAESPGACTRHPSRTSIDDQPMNLHCDVFRCAPPARMALLALCATLAACAPLGPNFQRPEVAVQTQWSEGDAADPAKSAAPLSESWWQQFDDPTLMELLAIARAGNPGLQSAAVRIAQAQAQLGITRAGEFPSVQFSAGPTYTKPDARSQLLGKTDGSVTLQAGLQSSWEPDFWGKIRRGAESDQASWLSSMAAYHAAQVSLEATVGSTYFSLRTLQQRVAVARANLAQQAESLRIAEARFRAGATSELDQRQAQVQFEQTQAQIPPLEAALQQAAHALGILLGRTPDYYLKTFAGRADAPRLQSIMAHGLPLGLPRQLLQRRPDVVQAEMTAAAQSARIGQAEAALYPGFSLSGAFGFQSNNAGGDQLSDIFSWSKHLSSISAGLLLPIFDRGRLVNQVRVQDALFEQALQAYETQVLKAQQEVEDALASIAGGTDSLKSLQRARDAVRRSAALAVQRYKSGESDYTTVTSSDQARLQVEDALTQTEGNLLQAYVAAFRALGGGWDGTLTPPALAQSVSTRMQARTDWGNALDAPVAPPQSLSRRP